ncbi:MAG: glycoside hydrolase family protein [Myxococcota bacterium]
MIVSVRAVIATASLSLLLGACRDPEGSSAAASCKRGLAYQYLAATDADAQADLAAIARGTTWGYNWRPQPEASVRTGYVDAGLEFAPMAWGADFTVDDMVAAIPDGSEMLLAFNEPNFFAQANMSAQEAASRWPELEMIASMKGLRISSPAVNYCAGGCYDTDPFSYLDDFFAACTDCQVDVIAAHWYACTGEALSNYLEGFAKYGRPIWLTEFSCGDGDDVSPATQLSYMRDAVEILEADANVERYAWFSGRTTVLANVDILAGSGALTDLGEQYLSLPGDACAP